MEFDSYHLIGVREETRNLISPVVLFVTVIHIGTGDDKGHSCLTVDTA